MREWVYIIFVVSLAGSMINILASGTKSEKYIKFLGGLCCMLAVISPVRQLIKSFDTDTAVTKTEISLPDGNTYVAQKTAEQTKEYISDYLYGKTGIICSDVRIEITVTDTETVIGDILVLVPKEQYEKAKNALFGIAEVISDG